MVTLNSILTFLAFYFFYILLEVIQRRFKVKGEYTRKAAHVLTGLGAIFASKLLHQKEFIFVTFVFLLVFIVSYKKRFFNSIHAVERKTYGEITYPLGILLIAIFSYNDPRIFIYGLLLLAVPDVAAYVVGKRKSVSSEK